MVKTRHGGDVDTSPGGEILSLRSRNAKRFSRSDAEDNMLSSGDDNTPRSKRQRIVSMRASGGNSEESSGYRGMTRRSYHSSGASPPTPEQRTKGKDKSSPDSTVPSNQTPSTSKNQKEFALSRSREFRSLTKDSHVEVIEGEDDEDGIRRSRRPRKQIYSTMNQNLLTEMMLAGGANPSPEEVILRRKKPLRPPRKEETNDDEEEEEEDEEDDEEEEEDVENSEPGTDMYSRIKNRQIAKKLERQREREERQRRQQEKEEEKLKRRQEEGSSDEEDESEDDSEEEEEEEDDEEEEEEGEEPQPQYSLRQHRQITDRYSAPMSEPMRKRQQKYEDFINPHSPLRRRHFKHKKHLTPVHSPRIKRRTHHGARDLSSTSSEGSDDERRFERRKNKSMMRARNRCLPMNLTKDDMSGGVIKDRQRIGGSLADVDPMNIDSSVTFDTVGGLGSHVQALKEMVVFPLLYPEVFERFKIAPPRGVLFHGPPGTGKTLVARALANECKQGDKRVAFFMRKGADCLSKWVGESERQLRLLFDQAFTMRPSIIFFDEIDGLAPVRSSRQDQIHSSIVSTLLALMDGLDSRGEIVVIGATNRIDAIDPALRRPGRFDREFLFPLPSVEARTTILNIHTKQWNPRLSEAFVSEVAAKCVGYCGADLKALCTEAALYALRRRYPQIYTSKEKLQLDVTEIQIGALDFHHAMKRIVPASQRSVVSPGRSLTLHVRPLLENQFNAALDILRRVFPSALYKDNSTSQEDSSDPLTDMLQNDDWDEEGGPSIFNGPTPRTGSKKHSLSHSSNHSFLNFASTSYHRPHAHRPRFLITGQAGMGQTSHLGPALLHHMERLPVHCLDLPALYACSAKTPEESCAQVFLEARRTSPSIIYVPHICQWWEACSATLQATFLTLLQDLPPSAPILLLATSDFPLRDAPVEMQSLFIAGHGEVMKMSLFKMDERREFFRDLVLVQATKAPHRKKKIASAALEVLPVVAPREPRELTEEEIQKLISEEEKKLRELRIFLRDVLTRLASERKFRVFTSPVDPEEVPDYVEVIKQPMDLFTMNNKINLHQYTSAKQFLGDIDLITSNALEYNPDRQPSDRMIRNRACELKDMAYAIIDAEMDSDFEKECGEIEESRSRRQENPTVTAAMAPSFYKTFHQLTLTQAHEQARELANQKLKPHQLDSSREEDGIGGTGRPKKVKKKHSKRRSAWSRGFLSKNKKKKPVIDEEEDSEEEDEEEREEEEGEEAMEDGEVEILHNGPLTNGDIFNHQETSNQSAETSTAPSTLSQITDDTPIGTQRSPRLSHRLDNRDSDRESVKSGPCSPQSELVIGRRSLRRNSNHAPPTHHQLQNGISSEESSEIDPPTLEKVVPYQRVKGDRSKTKEIIEVMEVQNGEEEAEEERRRDEGDTPTSAESTKEKDSHAALRRSSRRPTRSLHNDPVAMVARNILDEPVPKLVVDLDRLERLLESVTLATTNFNIEKLERMYSVLSHHVYRHRMDYDKTELIKDMEQEVMNITVYPLD